MKNVLIVAILLAVCLTGANGLADDAFEIFEQIAPAEKVATPGESGGDGADGETIGEGASPVIVEGNAERRVFIEYSFDDVLSEGEALMMTAILEGFEGLTVSYRWQYFSGSEWTDIPGADEKTLTIIAGDEALRRQYRVCVRILEAVQ